MNVPLPQLPLPGAALAEELDKPLLVQLRDGRKIIGILRSFDQFANLVIESAVERIFVGQRYGDVPLGLQLIRGENVVLLEASGAELKQALKDERELNKMKATIR